jgi:uncharacterized membrane protein YdcZ (DUF606 family)
MNPTLYVVVLTTTFLMLASLIFDLFTWISITNRMLLIPLIPSTILIVLGLIISLKK